MAIDMESSEIIQYMRKKRILVTGGTGFIGRVLIEHLLRKCEVDRIYVLVRAKKGVEPKDRKQANFSVPLFDKLKAINPDFMDSIIFVNGDMIQPGLGLDDATREQLINDVQIVFHTAASVTLQSKLKEVASINVKGTKGMCLLCSKMKNLEAFVYVSTAYSQANEEIIEESVYEPPMSADDLINVTDSLSAEKLNEITETIICGWPNAYTFSKAVTEGMLKTFADRMPIAIVRPGLIISTKSDPIVGWVDNMYGPIGFVSGTAVGILRTSNTDPNANAELVPADFVCSVLIAAAHKIGKEKTQPEVPVYNIVTDPSNPISYATFSGICNYLRDNYPPSYSLYYINHTCVKNHYLHLVFRFWLHIFPALIVDGFLRIIGKKPKVMKIYKKIHSFIDGTSFVSIRTWRFKSDNIRRLREDMNETDKKLFDFDMSAPNIDWQPLITNAVNGISIHLFKEDLFKATPQTKRKHFWFHILHRIIQVVYLALFYWIFKTAVWTIQFVHNAVVTGAQYAVCDV